jgi:TolB-like protein
MSAEPVLEPARSVPVAGEADVCVVGGSCTGAFAAVAAARRGARVALVEAQGMLGGTATSGLVAVWHSLLDARFERQIIAGLTAEIIERLDRRGALVRLGRNASLAFTFNPAELAIELDRLAAEAGVRVFLHGRFAAPALEDGRVAAAVIEDKSGRRAVRARFFVDASGDGDLVQRAGLGCRTMDDLQPPTTCAVLRGLAALRAKNPGFSINAAVFDPKFEGALDRGFLWTAELPLGDDMTLVAGTRVNGADCSDADQLTRAETEGRAQVRRIVDLLRKNFAGGEELRLAALPGHIGVRQTRQILGRHRLTEQEVLAGTRFPDAIANGSYRVDVHHNDRAGITFRYLDGREVFCRADGTHQRGRWRPEQSEDPTFYQVPYRALVPEGSRNVLAAGRLLDADRGAFGAVRVMVNCNQTGEAAGVAAWLALDSGRDAGEIDAGKLRAELSAGGAAVI